ncbi:MAG: winged helix-turn-helix domain-containing protein [Phycisphaerae bacterium]|nr:winged helix-turn-helix domain-containing protein [Phycisphaerae bacterium]
MKKDEVQVGGVYTAKVGTQVVPVRITSEKWNGDKHAGWVATNVTTGRSIRVKSAQRLRREVGDKATGGNVAAASATATHAEATPPASDATAANVGELAANGGEVVVTAGSPKPRKSKQAAKAKGNKASDAKTGCAKKDAKPKRTSALDAAATVLAASKEPLNCKQIVAEMEAKGLWRSPGGRTPQATLYAAVIREIAAKGRESRFRKTDRGLFVAARGA